MLDKAGNSLSTTAKTVQVPKFGKRSDPVELPFVNDMTTLLLDYEITMDGDVISESIPAPEPEDSTLKLAKKNDLLMETVTTILNDKTMVDLKCTDGETVFAHKAILIDKSEVRINGEIGLNN